MARLFLKRLLPGLSVLLPMLARADLYVGTTVTDASASLGSEANPYLTFKDAGLAAAASGQDVTILAGTYSGQNITASGSASNALVFNAQAGVTILNDGSLTGGVVKSTALNIDGSYVQVNGVNVVGNSAAAGMNMDAAMANIFTKDPKFSTSGIVVAASHVTVSNCVVTNTTGAGMRIQGQTVAPTDYVTFTGNVVANCGWYTPVGSGAGIVVAAIRPEDTSTAAKILIQGNMIYASQGRLISNVDTKNFATLTLDEGQGIMLTRMDTYTAGSVKVDDNVVMYSGSKAISSQFGTGAIITNNTTYMDGTTGSSDPTPILINKTPDSVVQNNLLVTYARNNGVGLMGTTAEKASVTVSGNVIVGENTAIFGGDSPGSLIKTDASVTAGADNATVAALQAKLATVLNQGQAAPVSWYLSTADFYRQQVNYMMLNGTGVNGAIRLDRNDPAGPRQYVSNLAGTPQAEVLGVVATDPVSGATFSFNNRTPVFTQWADSASPISSYAANGFKLVSNDTLQTYFVNAAWVPVAGGDASGFLLMQRTGSLLTLTAEQAGGLFSLASVDLATGAGLSGVLRVTGRRAGVTIASADLTYDENLQVFHFGNLGGDWTSLDEVTFERTSGDRLYLDNLNLVAVPEPAAFGFAGVAAFAGAAAVRRRRRATR